MKKILVSLGENRKVWLTILTVASTGAMYWRHAIDGGQMAQVLAASVSVLVLAMAHEQNGINQAGTNIAAGGDVTVTPAAPDSSKLPVSK